MNRIDEIERKLPQGTYRKFINRLIDLIKSKYEIFQYNIASELNVEPTRISYLKTFSRIHGNDELTLEIIDKYPVDIDALINEINTSFITREKEKELNKIRISEKIKDGNFDLALYIYNEINDHVVFYNLNINIYSGHSKITNNDTNQIEIGRFEKNSIEFKNVKSHSNTIILNGKLIGSLIRSKKIISGFSTEMDHLNGSYEVKPVLITPLDLDKGFKDLIKFYFRKKELQNEFKSCTPDSFKNKVLENKKHNKELNIKIPPELVTGYNQFLQYFSDYVQHAKGENIEFNIVKLKDGLDISLSVSDDSDIETVGNYLDEYLNFTKQNIEELKVNIETDISKTDFSLLVLDLKHQVTGLKHSLELASVRNESLSGQVDHLKELSINFSKKENVIHAQVITGGDQQFADKIKNKP